MESWEERLQRNILQKAVNTQFGYDMPLDELLEKAAPIGTRKTWQGGREFVKTAEGWKPVGKKKEAKESGGFSNLSDVELLNEYNVVKDALRNDHSFNQKPSLPSEIETYKKQLKQIESEIQKRNDKIKTQPEPEKKPDSIVISDPDKFKVEIEVVNDKYNRPRGKKYKINGVVVCETKQYLESFCGRGSRGEPSNIRSVSKMAYDTNWNRDGLAKVTGFEKVPVGSKSRRQEFFNDNYPDTTWGDTGGAVSSKEVKEKISAFLKGSKNPDGSLRKTSYSWVTDDDRNQIKEILGPRTITDEDQSAVAKILGLDPKDPKFDMSWSGNNTGLYPTKTIVIKYGGETLAHSRTYPA